MHVALYGLTLFASAFLLFSVQPMAGKALLPQLGGAPAAWTACLLFFQAALLAGYSYVWLSARLFTARLGALVHVFLVSLPLWLFVPFRYPHGPSGIAPEQSPAMWVLVTLALNVGALFVVLSASAPLLQHWFAQVSRRRPYFLYVASNAGSLGALLSYPVVVEPYLALAGQHAAMRWGYGGFAVGLLVAASVLLRVRETSAEESASEEAPPSGVRRAKWVALSAVPAMLLAGSSTTLSTDLAPIPLLWVLPLAIYLATFIAAFSETTPEPPALLQRASALIAVVLVIATVSHANEPVWLLAVMHVVFLAAGSWVAHRRLARDAPDPRYLSEFYVWIALGGVLGTLVSVVIAPKLLPDLWEYPAAIALACALRDKVGAVRDDESPRGDAVHVLVTLALVVVGQLAAPRLGLSNPRLTAMLSFGPAALYLYRFMPLRRRFTLCLLALLVGAALIPSQGKLLHVTRSFFGVLRVVDQDDERQLLHGTTLHGAQRLSERASCQPLSYYAPSEPLGEVMKRHDERARPGDSVVIGLGTGAIACYSKPGERWNFIEINPDVIRIADNDEWFTYLSQSPSRDLTLTLGDGRLKLADHPNESLSLLIIDAFNSDSVPVHLLSQEAFVMYFDKVGAGGWTVLHLSNRALNLGQVIADVAARNGLAGRIAHTPKSSWAVLATSDADLSALDRELFRPLPEGRARKAWTDSFSSIWSAIE